jgi:ADP-heptose:LPS heptosyltransferase
VQIQLLKLIDKVLGSFVAACLPAARARQVLPRRILLIRPGGIGDAVLLVPAILALREKFPEAEISVLAERRNGPVFSLCSAVDCLLLYDNIFDLIKTMGGRYDLVIDTEQWHRLSAVVGRLTGAPFSIGFATNNRKRLFSHQIGYSHDDYEGASFLNLLRPLGITPVALRFPFLTVPGQAARRAAELLAPLSGKPLVAIFPGASIAERRWGAERFRSVAELLAKSGMAVVVVGGPADAADGELAVAGGFGLNLAGKTTLAETAAVIASSALLVSGDSGVLHIAVGLGVATVSLFGPGIAVKWAPKGDGHIVLNKHLDCSPCSAFGYTPRCRINGQCMSDITVEEVFAAVKELLKRQHISC